MQRRILAGWRGAIVLVAAGIVGIGAAAMSAAQPAAQPAEEAPPLNDLERAFAEKLSGATLVGRYTVDGKENQAPKDERYELIRVAKLRDEYWVFNARVKYGNTDVTVPITLKVLWAGDTPMISMTDLNIPGLGTFTSRVFFYGDRYAGTWQHGEVGGHLFGRIEPAKQPAEPAKQPE